MMKNRLFTLIAATFVANTALGFDGTSAGSLLVYPEYNNANGTLTILTVSNIDDDESVEVEFTYVHGNDCGRTEALETLTPNDTLSLLGTAHQPGALRGYLFVAAVDSANDERILHNGLIGTSKMLDGFSGSQYTLRPFSYQGIDPTDDGNGLADLDGVEYEESAAVYSVPNFLGFRPGSFSNEIILIGLSGGAQFATTVEFEIYNDNEEEFSAEFTFECWTKVPARNVSSAFRAGFLAASMNDPNEMLGAPGIETGWFRARGAIAESSTTTIAEPAILIAFVEHVRESASADIPFTLGANANGKLLASNNTGTQ